MNPASRCVRAYLRFWPMYRPAGFVMGLVLMGAICVAAWLGRGLTGSTLLGGLSGALAGMPAGSAWVLRQSSLGGTLPFHRKVRIATGGALLLLAPFVAIRTWAWAGAEGVLLALGLLSLVSGLAACFRPTWSWQLLVITFAVFVHSVPNVLQHPWVSGPVGLGVGGGLLLFGLSRKQLRSATRSIDRWTSSTVFATVEPSKHHDRPVPAAFDWSSSWQLPNRGFRSWLGAVVFEASSLPPRRAAWLLPGLVIGEMTLISATVLFLLKGDMTWSAAARGVLDPKGFHFVVWSGLLALAFVATALVTAGCLTSPPRFGDSHPLSRRQLFRLNVVGGLLALVLALGMGLGVAVLFGWGLGSAFGLPVESHALGALVKAAALTVLVFPWLHRLARQHPLVSWHPSSFEPAAWLAAVGALALPLVLQCLWLGTDHAFPTLVEWSWWLLATLTVYLIYGWRVRAHFLRGDLV